MRVPPPKPTRGVGTTYLGIDGGATRTTAMLADEQGHELGRFQTQPANLKLLSDAQLREPFREIARVFPHPDAIAIGLAGAWDEPDRRRIRRAASACWPRVPCHATHDLEIALAAAPSNSPPQPEVLILSGTGSCCFGRTPAGRVAKIGGWGHTLGDQGSGYDIGLSALRAITAEYDLSGRWPVLGACLLQALQLNEPKELISWAQQAAKPDIARLALPVFLAAAQRDRVAARVIDAAARRLAADAVACAKKLAPHREQTRFVLAGGVLEQQPGFRARVIRELHRLWPGAVAVTLDRAPAWGAVLLARRQLQRTPTPGFAGRPGSASPPEPSWAPPKVKSTRLSPTEGRNPRSLGLDQLGLGAAIELMLSEEGTVPRKLLAEKPRIERAVQLIAKALGNGGRLFYVGAGTSGRLGVLDASECPPTFNTPPGWVQGIIAGGAIALWSSVEGEEDDHLAGARAITFRRVSRRDVVVGVAASGTTPFVWGALGEAARRCATTILVCFNPYLEVPPVLRPRVMIAPNLGPELLTGSTRLKAGTATKLLLNLFTTLAMVQLGKVMSNLMVDVRASNVKLRARAVRIVQALAECDPATAQAELEANRWEVRAAVKAARASRSGRHASTRQSAIGRR